VRRPKSARPLNAPIASSRPAAVAASANPMPRIMRSWSAWSMRPPASDCMIPVTVPSRPAIGAMPPTHANKP
jgi:hypothetical protein